MLDAVKSNLNRRASVPDADLERKGWWRFTETPYKRKPMLDAVKSNLNCRASVPDADLEKKAWWRFTETPYKRKPMLYAVKSNLNCRASVPDADLGEETLVAFHSRNADEAEAGLSNALQTAATANGKK